MDGEVAGVSTCLAGWRPSSEGEEGLGRAGVGSYLVYTWFSIDNCLFALVLRRVKVTFIDTVLRIEHVPENSKTGAALEIRVDR